jgi:2,5-furandicarboxylate decarboxylase 1
MPYQDFRQFLDVLRQHGELIDVNRPVELSDVGKAMKQSYVRQGPAIMFNQNGTDYPLVASVYSTRSKALLAFEADEDTIFDKVVTGLDNPIAPTMLAGNAPCQDEIITGEDIDIRRWPIPTYSPKDGGPYITPGIVVSEDPETGVPDIGHYRFLILGKDTVSFSAQPFHRFGKHLAKHKRAGSVPKAALVIGVDPILAYTCQVQVPDDTNDWSVAGGLRGAPVELTRCTTCDLAVPATSEVVFEFEVDLNETVLEGPLGEYTGYYTRPSHKPVAASPPSPTAASRSSRDCSRASRSPKTTSSSKFPSRRRSCARSSASSPPSRRFRCVPPPVCRSTW